MNSLPKTVTRQRRGCNLNPGPSAPESSTLTTRLPSNPKQCFGVPILTLLLVSHSSFHLLLLPSTHKLPAFPRKLSYEALVTRMLLSQMDESIIL